MSKARYIVKPYSEIMDLEEKLIEYCEIECHELSEAVRLLCHLAHYSGYVSDELYSAVIKEMEAALYNYQENAEIIETRTERTIVENLVRLRWNNE